MDSAISSEEVKKGRKDIYWQQKSFLLLITFRRPPILGHSREEKVHRWKG